MKTGFLVWQVTTNITINIVPVLARLRLNITTTRNDHTMAVDKSDFVSYRRSVARHYCVLCGKVFRRKGGLTRHMDGPHANSNTLMYGCRGGHYQTARKGNYMRHLNKCAMKRKSSAVFRCRCGIADNDNDEGSHFAHIQRCQLRMSSLDRMASSFPRKTKVQPPTVNEAERYQHYFRRTLSASL